jgi:hypothetical protein
MSFFSLEPLVVRIKIKTFTFVLCCSFFIFLSIYHVFVFLQKNLLLCSSFAINFVKVVRLARAFAQDWGAGGGGWGGVCEAILTKRSLGKVCWCILGKNGKTRWGVWK